MKALLLIDIQKGLTKRDLYNKEEFLNTANQAIEKYRASNHLIIFVQHQNKQLVPDTADWEIDENILLSENDKVFSKQKGDAFTNKELVAYLIENDVKDILVGGLVTHGCVKHTCKGGIAKGFNISLLKNGHSCWNGDAKDKIKDTEIFLKNLGIDTVDLNN